MWLHGGRGHGNELNTFIHPYMVTVLYAMLAHNDSRTVQFIYDPSGLFRPKSVEVSRTDIINPKD